MAYDKNWNNMGSEEKRTLNIKNNQTSSRSRARRGDITEAALDVLGAYAPDKLLNNFQQFLTTPRLRNHATLAHVLVLSTLVKALQGDARARDTMFKVGSPTYQPAPVMEITTAEKDKEDDKMLPLYDAIDRSAVHCWGADNEQPKTENSESLETTESEPESESEAK